MALRTPKNADRICELLADGATLRQVAREVGCKSIGSITDWVQSDEEFAARYARAMDLRWAAKADELEEISDDGTNDWMEREGYTVPNGEHIQRSRLRVDTRKWLLSKMLPKVYGDRTTLAGDPNAPLVNVLETDPSRIALAMLNLLEAGRQKPSDEPQEDELDPGGPS